MCHSEGSLARQLPIRVVHPVEQFVLQAPREVDPLILGQLRPVASSVSLAQVFNTRCRASAWHRDEDDAILATAIADAATWAHVFSRPASGWDAARTNGVTFGE